jgi:hypothetical protein
LKKKDEYHVTGTLAQIKVSYAWSKKHLAADKWVGVVLRNLPPVCTADMLKKNLTKEALYTITAID